MTAERDFYEVLGVDRTAGDADIKRAFRKLAQQWHPDVNTDPKAQERFKEVNEAYQVLSDPQRRQAYDMFGRAGVNGGAGGGPGGPGGPFGAGGGRLRRASATSSMPSSAAPRRARPGVRDPARAPTCATTSGSRSRRPCWAPRRRSSSRSSAAATPVRAPGPRRGSTPVQCPQCNGRGEVRSVRQTMLGQMVNVAACPRCRGEGKVVENPCAGCKGEGRTERRRSLRVSIPAGHRRGSPDPADQRGRGRAPRRRAGEPLCRHSRRGPPHADARGHRALLRGRPLHRAGCPGNEAPRPDGRRRGCRGGDQARDPARNGDQAARPRRAAPAPPVGPR